MTESKTEDNHPALITIILVICAVAVVLNILVIVMIVRIGRLQTSVDIFLTNLAVSDILLAGLVHPLHFKNVFLHDHSFIGGMAVCKIIMFFPTFIIMSTIFTIVATATDRYRVMIRHQTLSKRGAFIIVGIIWVVSAAISAPQIYEYNVYKSVDDDTNMTLTACGSEGIVEQFETIYASCLMVVYYVSSLMLTICYGRIAFVVWKNAKRFQVTQTEQLNSTSVTFNSGSRLGKKISARKIKVFKMLASVTLTFIFLWTPYFVLFSVQEISDMDHSNDFGKWPHLVSRAMTVISTVVNPTLYLAFCDPFRIALCSMCTCRWAWSSGSDRTPPSVTESCDLN